MCQWSVIFLPLTPLFSFLKHLTFSDVLNGMVLGLRLSLKGGDLDACAAYTFLAGVSAGVGDRGTDSWGLGLAGFSVGGGDGG